MSIRHLTLSAGTLALLVLGHTAHAQNFIGVGVAAIPEYEGSSTYRALPIPMINYQSGDFFISPRAGLPAMGLKMDVAQDLTAGVFLSLNLGRKASRTARTEGLDDIKFHAGAGAFIEWAPGPLSLGAAYRYNLHSGYGSIIDLRASYEVWQSGPNRVRVGADTQWASHSAMNTWFGVSDNAARNSVAGLSSYSASAGFKSVSLFSTWSYQLNKDWSTITTIGVNQLLGDAKDSPLTAQSTNLFGNVGVIYRF